MSFFRILLALLLVSGVARAQTTAPMPALVVRLDAAAHARSVADFQRELNHEFNDPQQSPLPPRERREFTALPYYPVSYAHYVLAHLVRDSTSAPFAMVTSSARRPQYRKYGELHFTLEGQPLKLSVYQDQEPLTRPDLADYLFLPFTDGTNGHGSYGGGRFIDLRIPPKGTGDLLLLDFNRAYNPSCAYSAGYSCPVPPAENRLSVAVPAGVRSDH